MARMLLASVHRMKVNLECGQQKLFGFINVDADPWVRPDVVAVPMDLPFDPGSVEEIYAPRVLEQLADPVAALRYWRGLLTADGVLWVAVAEPHSAGTPSGGDSVRSLRIEAALQADESRPDHSFSPYFLALCLRTAGYGEITRAAGSPYARAGTPHLLTYRGVNVHPLRKIARRFWTAASARATARQSRQIPV